MYNLKELQKEKKRLNEIWENETNHTKKYNALGELAVVETKINLLKKGLKNVKQN